MGILIVLLNKALWEKMLLISLLPFKIYQKEGYADVCLGTLMQRAQDTASNIQEDRISPGERQIYKPIAYCFQIGTILFS